MGNCRTCRTQETMYWLIMSVKETLEDRLITKLKKIFGVSGSMLSS